jgi:hypothetical protein
MWQEIIVALCVVAAAYFVLRQWLPIGKKNTASCGGCGGCEKVKGRGEI